MYKLSVYRTNVDQQKLEILNQMLGTVEKSKNIPLKLSPDILRRISADLGFEGTCIEDFKCQYEKTIVQGKEKWRDLQAKLQGRLSVVYAQLHILDPTELNYLHQRTTYYDQIKQIEHEVANLEKQYTLEVSATVSKWGPYTKLLKNIDHYYCSKDKELTNFQEKMTTHLDSLDITSKSEEKHVYSVTVKYNQMSVKILTYPEERVEHFLHAVLKKFGLEKYNLSVFTLFIPGGPHLHEKERMGDYTLAKIPYLKLVWLLRPGQEKRMDDYFA